MQLTVSRRLTGCAVLSLLLACGQNGSRPTGESPGDAGLTYGSFDATFHNDGTGLSFIDSAQALEDGRIVWPGGSTDAVASDGASDAGGEWVQTECGRCPHTACTIAVCNKESGQCGQINVTAQSNTECNDNDPCTFNDRCITGGQCKGARGNACEDDNTTCGAKRTCDGNGGCIETFPGAENHYVKCVPPGTDSTCVDQAHCDGKGQCAFDLRRGQACNDKNGCTLNDQCNAKGQCVPGAVDQTWHTLLDKTMPPDKNQDQTSHSLRPWEYNWSVDHHWEINVDLPYKSIHISGSADDGGYCYAYWGSGHVAVYKDDVFGIKDAQCTTANATYTSTARVCPSCSVPQHDPYTAPRETGDCDPRDQGCHCPWPPLFDNSGVVQVKQTFVSPGGPLTQGSPQDAHPAGGLEVGTKIQVRGRYTRGENPNYIQCKVEASCANRNAGE